MPRFKVKCECPTPLAENPAEVEAETVQDARKAFFKLNGISDTSWPLSIDEMKSSGPKKAAAKKGDTPETK